MKGVEQSRPENRADSYVHISTIPTMNESSVIENAGNRHIVQDEGEQILLFMACIFWPVYLFPSGGFQIFVIFLLCFCGFVAIRKASISRVLRESHLLSRAMLVFLAYSFIVNGYHAISFGTIRPIIYSLYYCFAFVVAICISSAITDRSKILAAAYYGITASVIVQLAVALVIIDDSCTRITLFFNNPNQLGFYTVLCMGFLTFLYPSTRQNLWLFLIAALANLWLAVFTLSLAAVVCIALMLVLQMVFGHKSVRKGLFLTVLAALPIFLMSQDFLVQKSECNRFEMRRIVSGQNSVTIKHAAIQGKKIKKIKIEPGVLGKIKTQLNYRGYDRMWNFPEFLVFGAGEGIKNRNFQGDGSRDKELHSAPATLFFSYGIFGLGFFIYIVSIIILKRGLAVLILLIPLALYSMFHNTLRQPFLWMLVALLIYAPYSLKGSYSPRGRTRSEPDELDKTQ